MHDKAAVDLVARRVLVALNAARLEVIPGSTTLRATASNLRHLAARLAEGHTEAELLHVIAVRVAEVRRDAAQGEWFNAITPFRSDSFARALARKPGDASAPTTTARGAAPPSAWHDKAPGEM